MESSAVAVAPPPPEEQASPETKAYDGEAEATRSAAELFQWSDYVHVGRGASECPEATTGKCSDPGHFHAWVCMPNTYQVRDIVDKSAAAKARKRRALHEEGSDAYETLEMQLDEAYDDHRERMISELSKYLGDKRLLEFIRELRDDERFEHYDQDAQEYRRLSALPEDERGEEFERLHADMESYREALQARVDEELNGQVERLRALPRAELLDEERRRRVELITNEAYNHTYYTWAIYVGVRDSKEFSSTRRFKSLEELHAAPPEVVQALRDKIADLELRMYERGGASGNS